MLFRTLFLGLAATTLLICLTQSASAQTYADYYSNLAATQPAPVRAHPAWKTENYNLFDYRRLMVSHQAPNPHELQGTWRGVNKGIATVAIDKRFVKNFQHANGQFVGDNVLINQNSLNWQPRSDHRTGEIERHGKFLVQQPGGHGAFGHGVVLNYRKGGNDRKDPANLISDQVVKLDDNHMLGRATAKFGPFRIPLAYFVLQREP